MDLCFLWQAVAELPLERLDEGGSVDGKGGLPHLHLDILMITEVNRLSAKTLITTVAFFATVQNEGERVVTRQIAYYNLDVIISVGYRVKSLRGTQFRIWAINVLKEYMRKGFALDDDRLKRLGGGNYFDEYKSNYRLPKFQ